MVTNNNLESLDLANYTRIIISKALRYDFYDKSTLEANCRQNTAQCRSGKTTVTATGNAELFSVFVLPVELLGHGTGSYLTLVLNAAPGSASPINFQQGLFEFLLGF